MPKPPEKVTDVPSAPQPVTASPYCHADPTDLYQEDELNFNSIWTFLKDKGYGHFKGNF